jgi:3-phenylpropionate/trans-cinnamate dioxygenase ferredoxin reductase subunit
MNVNVWDVVDDLNSIIAAGRTVEPARLADAAIPLAELA